MTTISPSLESKVSRFAAEPSYRWIENPFYLLPRRYKSIFSDEGPDEAPVGPPVYDPEPPVHTE